MKCPWCNAELKDGALYCDTCGNEINMVPDFDPEIEDQCRETIESMTKDFFSSGKAKNVRKASPDIKKIVKESESVVEKTDVTTEPVRPEKKQNNKVLRFILFLSIFLALIIAAIVIGVRVSSDSYKLSQAQKAYSSREYDKAVALYSLLVEKDPYNIDLLEEYSYALYAFNDKKTYVEVLYRIADSSGSTDVQREQAYERLIYIYSGEKDYAKIQALVISSEMDELNEKYKDYLNVKPEILLAEGKYDLPQMLTLSSSDVIYYTLIHEYDDVSEVLVEDEIYRLPVLLEMGTYKLTAYTKNKYDLKSESVTATYDIELAPPLEPEVNIPSGTYNSPELLEVFYDSDNIIVYYTVDGSIPTTSSQIYNESIVIPSGYTKYSFVCVDEHGLYSAVVVIEIDMQYEYSVQSGTAKDSLIMYLIEKGTIISYDGTMPDGGCLELVLTGFEPVGENYCYVFEEAMMVDDILTYLDVKYTVDMLTGEINKMD